MNNFPTHIILLDRVYRLSILRVDGGRAFNRLLLDHSVEGKNPANHSDKWRVLLGATSELYEDYPSFKSSVPLEWVLIRFLMHHMRTNSLDVLSGPGGEVLTTKNFQDFTGSRVDEDQVPRYLAALLRSWARVMPKDPVPLADVYSSTDIHMDSLLSGINELINLGALEEIEASKFAVNLSALSKIGATKKLESFDRKTNRYFQEIRIQATEPYCFVIMPFTEKEFPQDVYQVIKSYVEDCFGIRCYRVDEDAIPDRIDNKIYTYLSRAAFVVAEVTSKNPNVFYELGLAHMLEKDTVLLTQSKATDLPFDINRISIEPYDSDLKLKDILKKSISALGFSVRT